MIEIAREVVTQLGIIAAALVAAWSARGAKNAAQTAQRSGREDHAEQTEQLTRIERQVNEHRRDIGGLREENRQTRREVHDLRNTVTRHLEEE